MSPRHSGEDGQYGGSNCSRSHFNIGHARVGQSSEDDYDLLRWGAMSGLVKCCFQTMNCLKHQTQEKELTQSLPRIHNILDYNPFYAPQVVWSFLSSV